MAFRVALCQINTLPGDVPGNLQLIRAAAAEARARQADLAVFPELALVGYCPRDLLFRRRLQEAADDALATLAEDSRAGALLVGTFGRNLTGRGRPFTNEAVLLAGGAIVARVPKVLLPVYDVFDEARYFEPGGETQPVVFQGRRLGIMVCEDLWSQPVNAEAPGYRRDPAAALATAGAEILINLSASPYNEGKPHLREQVITGTARRVARPLVLVNLVGGNDDVLFDGRSTVCDARGAIMARSPAFVSRVTVVDMDAPAPAPVIAPLEAASPAGSPAELFDALVMGVRDYATKCGFRQVHLGLSGGIDSALVAIIAVEALGRERVRGFALPSRFSSPGSVSDARELAARLGIRMDVLSIEGVFGSALETATSVLPPAPFGAMEENIQSRARGLLLMAIANRTGSLLLTTGNKSELATGYCTLYGDMCGGLAAISDVYKTEVYAVARHLAATRDVVPPATLTKPPSAELRPNQTDQDSLPPYDILDGILRLHLEDDLGVRDIVSHGFDEPTVRRVLKLVAANEFKRHQAAPGLRVSRKAFGQGRRMPIAASGLEWL